jgi:hypothetical protein
MLQLLLQVLLEGQVGHLSSQVSGQIRQSRLYSNDEDTQYKFEYQIWIDKSGIFITDHNINK